MDAQALIHQLIVLLDEKITTQSSAIMRHESFMSLEASWRGVCFMLESLPTMTLCDVRVKMLSISIEEIEKDCLRACEFDQSDLFQKIYANEYDHAGGEPYGLLVYDFYFQLRGSIDWIELADFISGISAAAFAPAVMGLSAQFFGLDGFSDLEPDLDMKKIFEQSEYRRFLTLREKEDTRFFNLVLPRVLLYQDALGRQVWGNPCYYLARTVMESFHRDGWFTSMRQVVMDHPGPALSFDLLRQSQVSSLEASVVDSMEEVLSLHGLISVMEYAFSNELGFRSVQSVHQASVYRQVDINANAILSTMMPYLLCACRFAHYLKVLIREKVGKFSDPDSLAGLLQAWLFKYCGNADSGNNLQLVKYPLKQAKITIKEKPMSPGEYMCQFDIQPNFYIEQVNSQLQFVSQVGRI
jgi:type VI secretion system protein ImpD